MEHSSGTRPHGLRVEYGGRTIAYSGDTEWTATLPELARDADLFVCECNFFDHKAPGHLDYQTLAEHLAELAAQRIVITHMSEEMLGHLSEMLGRMARSPTVWPTPWPMRWRRFAAPAGG